jgi:hypothetical protein
MHRSRPVLALLAGGLLGHVLAAYISGGSGIAYFHHIAGFFLIAAVTALPILGLTRLVARSHLSRAMVIFALAQFLVGAWIAIQEWQKRA